MGGLYTFKRGATETNLCLKFFFTILSLARLGIPITVPISTTIFEVIIITFRNGEAKSQHLSLSAALPPHRPSLCMRVIECFTRLKRILSTLKKIMTPIIIIRIRYRYNYKNELNTISLILRIMHYLHFYALKYDTGFCLNP